MAVNVAAVLVLVVFYLVILAVGLLAAWRVKGKGLQIGELETSLVAGRDLKTSIGIFTMIATTVGGGFINGTAEEVARAGLVWTLAPLGIFIGLNLGGAVYAKRMREGRYLTMLDPFQAHHGNFVTLLIYLASLTGDLLWTASILNALGTTLSVIADIDLLVAVLMSGSVTIIYTMLGSMISVAYTDVVQMIFILIGLVISLPFVFSHDSLGSVSATTDTWLGHVPSVQIGVWADLLVAMTLGTIPWQSYFQRVLSMKSARQAQILSFVGAVGALLLAVPPALLGIAGASLDWSNTTLGTSPLGTNQSSLILPLVINEFTPPGISLVGLGAISAAVMSSMDSSVLATSSMFTHNIYHEMFRTEASNRELGCVQVFAVAFFGCTSMAIAVWSSVIYGMFILAADIVFVIIFPQLTAVLYLPSCVSPAGAVAGFFLGLLLRIGAGEPIVDLPAWIHFPLYSESDGGQLFPFRTVSMLLSFAAIISISYVSRLALWNRLFSPCAGCEDDSGGRHRWCTGGDPATDNNLDADEEDGAGSSALECHGETDKGAEHGDGVNDLWIKWRGSKEELEMGCMQGQGQFRKLNG